MNENIINIDKTNRKRIYKTDDCVGCFKEFSDDEVYTEVKLPHHNFDEYIALCEKCIKVYERTMNL